MKDRDREIKKAIEDITGKSPKPEKEEDSGANEYLRAFSIQNVLTVSSSFDYFLLEEEGRLGDLFTEIFGDREFGGIPNILHVETGSECLDMLEDSSVDLVLVFNGPTDMDVLELSESVKDEHPDIPVVLLGNDTSELEEIVKKDNRTIDEVFTWNGDGNIILSIVQYIEDLENLENGTLSKDGRGILLIEDSIQYYSSYLPLIYDEIWEYLDGVMDEELPREIKLKRYWSRPYVLLAPNIDVGRGMYDEYGDKLVCFITDNHCGIGDEQDGLNFAVEVHDENPELPILVQSSEPIEELPEDSEIGFVLKSDATLNATISDFIAENIGPVELVVKNEAGAEIARIDSLDRFEESLWNVDSKWMKKVLKDGSALRWLRARAEFILADDIEDALKDLEDPERIKKKVISVIEEHRYSSHKGTVSSFKRREYNPYVKMSRIGKGALGGKARGLAFMAKILSKYVTEDMFEGLRITVPRTIVLSTEVYDSFLKKNDLLSKDIERLSDERISSKFMDGSLPATVLGDLRSFVRNTRNPLIVRSSGVLEDSMIQPFAGIYASMLLPNESWETDLRFQEVCNAIKHVYASTFFERSRTYLRSTPKKLGDEKMGVILQEVVGRKHEKYFYPTISGVAKSYNHYPSGPCKPEDGIVYMALGLGKAVVDGGNTYCFCPKHPKAPMAGTPKDFMKYAQRDFYAIDLESVYKAVKKDEETSLVKLGLDKAEKHGVLDKIVSTYSARNDRLYPGTHHEGARIVDFAPIINYRALPVAKALEMLLKVSEIALGYPVEIEFAVNINDDKNEPAELVILQIRSMVSKEMFLDVDLEEFEEEELLCYSDNALGNGVMKDIRDVVYIKSDEFEMKNSRRAVDQIRKVNKELMEHGRPYVLIGPGRWGTSDEWLGVPVIWSDIAGAKVIVETPTEGRAIEPSQGSHFFHDMISSQAGYLITKPEDGSVDWDWLESQELVDEKEDIVHVSTEEPMEVRIDGKSGKGIIIKKSNNEDEEVID